MNETYVVQAGKYQLERDLSFQVNQFSMSLSNSYLHLSLFCRGEDAQVWFPPAASHLRGKGGSFKTKNMISSSTNLQVVVPHTQKKLTPGRKTVNLNGQLFQNRHRFIGVVHFESFADPI